MRQSHPHPGKSTYRAWEEEMSTSAITRPTAYQWRDGTAYNHTFPAPSDPGVGWRFLLEEEAAVGCPEDTEFWYYYGGGWNKRYGTDPLVGADRQEGTYRTRAPLPGGPWYNPAGLLWPGLGFRFLVSEEFVCEGDEVRLNFPLTYRTRRPHPSPALQPTTEPMQTTQKIKPTSVTYLTPNRHIRNAILASLEEQGVRCWNGDPATRIGNGAACLIRDERGLGGTTATMSNHVSLEEFLAWTPPAPPRPSVLALPNCGYNAVIAQNRQSFTIGCREFSVGDLRRLIGDRKEVSNVKVTPLNFRFEYDGVCVILTREWLEELLALCEPVPQGSPASPLDDIPF